MLVLCAVIGNALIHYGVLGEPRSRSYSGDQPCEFLDSFNKPELRATGYRLSTHHELVVKGLSARLFKHAVGSAVGRGEVAHSFLCFPFPVDHRRPPRVCRLVVGGRSRVWLWLRYGLRGHGVDDVQIKFLQVAQRQDGNRREV